MSYLSPSESRLATAQVLDTAADYIEEYGWKAGVGWEIHKHATEGTCVEGALMAVQGYQYTDYRAFRECSAYRAVQDYLGDRTRALWGWNDWEKPGQEKVVQVLRGAAFAERRRARDNIKMEVMV